MKPGPTIAEIENALRVVAYGVVRHGDAYVPLLERLERELEAAHKAVSHRDRAAAILSSLTREVRNAQGA